MDKNPDWKVFLNMLARFYEPAPARPTELDLKLHPYVPQVPALNPARAAQHFHAPQLSVYSR